MTTYDKTKANRILSANGLRNTSSIIIAAEEAGLDLASAAALMEKESSGRNIFGHDSNGALAGYPGTVTKGAWDVFQWLINTGQKGANGVGPAQITSLSLLHSMKTEGLKPWKPVDNMFFGFRLLQGYFTTARRDKSPHPWVDAGTKYNGSSTYGQDLANKIWVWRSLLRPAEVA